MSQQPIEAISAALSPKVLSPEALSPGVMAPSAAPARTSGSAFADLLMGGVDKANRQVLDAQSQATAFALDDSIPVHQVTYALEQARLSVELMLQVRSKLADGVQELLRMQL